MALRYLDSSALVKAYVSEAGSARVREIVSTDSIAISILAVAEVASALARRRRDTTIDTQQASTLFTAFRQDIDAFEVIDVSRRVIDEAARRLLSGGDSMIRTLDALQLASAQIAFGRTPGLPNALVTSDRRLRDAAAAAGINVEDPTTGQAATGSV